MNNIIAYTRNTLDTFDQRPFNSVDSLVLASAAYIHFPHSLQELEGFQGIRLQELYRAEYFDEMRATYFEEDKYIPVYLNNSMVNFDVDPMIENGRTLVPVRAIFEAMGATVDWNGETRIVVAKKGDITVQIPINSDIIYKNSQSIKIDVPAQITDGRTFVPLRAISEAFGAKVEWNAEERFVNIFFE